MLNYRPVLIVSRLYGEVTTHIFTVAAKIGVENRHRSDPINISLSVRRALTPNIESIRQRALTAAHMK